MARPKSFNESNVLTQTMTVFWRKGYEATSMRDLESASGLTAGSIYNEFGSKKNLFIRSLDFYVNTVIQWRVDQLNLATEAPVDGIRHFLVSAIKDVPKPFRGQSCLLINTATELGQEDSDIGKAVQRGLKKIDKALVDAIERAKKLKQVKQETDSQIAANSLSLLLSGLLIAGKNQSKISTLESVVDFQMKQLIH